MKDWLKIRSNRVGAIFAIVHWLFLGLAIGLVVLSHSRVEQMDDLLEIGSFSFALLIFICNLPAIFVSLIIWSPLFFLKDYKGAEAGVVIMSFFTITYQWIIIGRGVFWIFSPVKSRMVVLSIFND